MKRHRSIDIRRYVPALIALVLLVAGSARAQSSPPAPSKDAVLQAAQGLDPEAPTTLQTIVTRLDAEGYEASVMAGGNGQPSDHKVWWQGEAWTFISSVNYQHGTYSIDPYRQAAYDGSGYSACGIPASAKQPCPSWWTPSTQPVPAPNPLPAPASLTQAQLDAAVAAIEAHDDANTAKVQAQINQVVRNAENTGKSIWTWLGPLLAGLGGGAAALKVAQK